MAASASRALQAELKDLLSTPLEGVQLSLGEDDNLFLWEVAIFGPPDTIYTGGYFKTQLSFPPTYPFNPPEMRFTPALYHPNVYADGKICISILHPPGEDEMSGELASERWSPAQRIRTILLSVISLLNEPNTSSPANVDASVDYRDWKLGKSDKYKRVVEKEVADSAKVAKEEGVKVPTTQEEYVIETKKPDPPSLEMEMTFDDDMDDFSDGDFDFEDCSPEPGAAADPLDGDSGNE